MMRVEITKKYKSIPAGVVFDIPNFCVITGKNGSGKSHLLEAMSSSETSSIKDSGATLTKIHL
jgi:predicted ATPase